MAHKVRFENGNDWQRVYIDGVLVYDHHSIDACDLLELLGIECESVWGSFVRRADGTLDFVSDKRGDSK